MKTPSVCFSFAKTLATGLALAACIPGASLRAEDAELQKLEARLAAAETQTDMNIASGEVAACLDRRLQEKETEVAKTLDSAGRKLFQTATLRWREYRRAEVDFEGDQYRGGSIQPLIHNQTFIRLTKERLAALAEVLKV